MTDPYLAPKSTQGSLGKTSWLTAFLPPFLASFLTLVLILFVSGIAFGDLRFVLRPNAVLILVAGSAVSSLVLLPYRGANWFVRCFLASLAAFFLLSFFGLLDVLGLLDLLLQRVAA